MELETAKGFLDLAKGLFDPIREFTAWRKDKKRRVAEFSEKIAVSLEKLADGVELGKPIDSHCGELSAYMDALMDLLKGVVPQERLDKYSKILSQATIQRKLIGELNDQQERSRGLSLIREAAGNFRGLANVLMV